MSRDKLHFDELKRFVSAEMASRKHPGSSVSVVEGDEMVWAKGFGYSNLQGGERATPETVYRCASITKPVITTGFLQLYEEGRFGLDDPANDHLDVKIKTAFSEQPTIRNLLTHYSGMPVRVGPIVQSEDETIPLREYVRTAARTIRPPGERWEYCNTAFNIIGYLFEVFTGQPYDAYCREHILKPLEMHSSDFEVTPRLKGALAQGYHRKGGPDGEIEPAISYIDGTRPAHPSGSLLSTVKDLANFTIAHLNGGVFKGRRILKPETVDEMHRLQASTGNSRSGMGLSWFRTIHYGEVMLSHTGSVPGFTNHLAFYPDLKLGVCWLSNLNDRSSWRPPAPNALRTLLGERPAGPRALQPVPDEWEKLIGAYGTPEGQVTVAVKNGYLQFEVGGTGYLERMDGNRFLVHGTLSDGYEVTFEYGEDGYARQFDLRTEVHPRYIAKAPDIREDAELIGSWAGEYAHTYGIFTLELDIVSPDRATATDMSGERIPLSDFHAERGRVAGSCTILVPRGYADWGPSEVQAKLELVAVNGRLEGLLTLSSKARPYRFVRSITLTRS